MIPYGLGNRRRVTGRQPDLPPLPATSFCNARTGKGYCRKPAGWGTKHPGVGRCRWHGGSLQSEASLKQPAELPVPKSLREAVEQRKNDPELLSLSSEIAMLRAIQERINLQLQEGGIDPNDPAVLALVSIADRIGKLVERAHRIELERRRLIPADRVVAFMDRLARAINSLVRDPEVVEAIYRIIDEGDEKL